MRAADFEAQLPEHLAALRSLANRLVGNRDDAQDVLQEALLRASKSLSAFREDCSLKTWLFSITTRVAIDHLRASKRWDKQVMVDACDERGRESVLAKFTDPSVTFDVQQHIAFCFTCIGRSLDPQEHAALVLSEVFQLANAEGARVLEVTESVFRHALSAARTAMGREYDGLCALVNKNGACYQCKVLREVAPEGQQGRALPEVPLPFEARLAQVRSAHQAPGVDQRLNDYFFEATRYLQARK